MAAVDIDRAARGLVWERGEKRCRGMGDGRRGTAIAILRCERMLIPSRESDPLKLILWNADHAVGWSYILDCSID
eukprot:m.196 g.196  ORF g.196 m.196 type:complete len:75 (+) comp948_c0_seq2:207-431(+)